MTETFCGGTFVAEHLVNSSCKGRFVTYCRCDFLWFYIEKDIWWWYVLLVVTPEYVTYRGEWRGFWPLSAGSGTFSLTCQQLVIILLCAIRATCHLSHLSFFKIQAALENIAYWVESALFKKYQENLNEKLQKWAKICTKLWLRIYCKKLVFVEICCT